VATAYKIVKDKNPLDWREVAPIYRFPINAAICTPGSDATVKAGKVELSGYVLPSGRIGSKVSKVLVSVDRGRSWTKADLTGKDMDFCWQLWKAQVSVTAATKQVWLRAEDSSGGFMPGRVPWNAKGYLQNSWHRLPVKVS